MQKSHQKHKTECTGSYPGFEQLDWLQMYKYVVFLLQKQNQSYENKSK